MPRPVTLFTGQWADLPFEEMCKLASGWGYDGLELACWGDHFDPWAAVEDDSYVPAKLEMLKKYDLQVFAISNHLKGQAVCDDPIDERHRGILPDRIWGDGDAEGVRQRAAEEMKATARAARKLGVDTVVGFTGSSIWKYVAMFPPASQDLVDAGYQDFADRWNPILDVFDEEGGDGDSVTSAPQDEVENAASKAAVGASNARRRTNSSASGAPTSRSIPASSHSTEIGPSYPIAVRVRKQSSHGMSPWPVDTKVQPRRGSSHGRCEERMPLRPPPIRILVSLQSTW